MKKLITLYIPILFLLSIGSCKIEPEITPADLFSIEVLLRFLHQDPDLRYLFYHFISFSLFKLGKFRKNDFKIEKNGLG